MKNTITQPGLFLTLLFLLIINLGVKTGNCDNVARYGADFLINAGGARALAMGSASTALPGEVWSIFWNPAALTGVQTIEAGLMHSERFGGVVDFDAFALVLPGPGKSALSAGLLRLGVNGIPFTKLENPGAPLSDNNRVEIDKIVNSGDYALFAAKAGIFRGWLWGVSPKLIFRHIGSQHKAFGLGLDAGLHGQPLKSLPLTTGLIARDLLGTLMSWNTGNEEIVAPSLQFGISSFIGVKALEAEIIPAIDLEYRFENFGQSEAIRVNAGLEYLVRQILALRIGSNDGTLTFGGGLNFKALTVDYAYLGHDELGDSHRISINARWQKK